MKREMRRESGNEQDAVFLTVPKLKKPFADVSKWAGVRTKAAVYATFEEGVEGYNGGTHGGYIMYDLVNDPYELNNLVDLPEHVLMQEELWDLLHILIKEAGEAPFFNMTP